MLTNRPFGGGPVTVGSAAVAGDDFSGNRLFVEASGPATGAGTTLGTVNFYAASAGTIAIMTGTLSGGNYTVRDISADLTAVAGLNTFTVSLAIVAGDYIAAWSPSSGGAGLAALLGAGTFYYSGIGPTTKPTATQVLGTSGSVGYRLSLNGSN